MWEGGSYVCVSMRRETGEDVGVNVLDRLSDAFAWATATVPHLPCAPRPGTAIANMDYMT